jgi:hypothetical protein
MGLEAMAPALGYGAASGVRQAINRALGKASYLLNMLKPADMEALKQYATTAYVKALEAAKLIDAEDADELTAMPQHVEELDSFRVFLSDHFIAPALRELEKTADKKIRQELKTMGIPDASRLYDTIVNQVTGAARMKPERVVEKLRSAKGIDPVATAKKVTSAIPKLKKLAELEGGLVDLAISRWERLASKRQQSLITGALETSVSDQETIEKLDKLTDEN